jgi:LPXTG-motif cell wall-anchored protein
MGLEVISFSVDGVDGVFAAGEVITVAGVGSLVINADGSYEFTPALGFVGDVPAVTFTVRDSFGLTASGILSIGVGSVLPRTGAELWEFVLLGLLLAALGSLILSDRWRTSWA